MKYYFALLCMFAAATGCGMLSCPNKLPPAERIMHPGPGVDGPGPGVLMLGGGAPVGLGQSSQVAFIGPEGMMIYWDAYAPGYFDSQPLIAPARYNFSQGAIYRLKLTNLAGRPGVELYPTIEIGPPMPRTDAYLAHNAIPVQLTDEDLDQVLTGNFVTKVIYLPDAEYQELAVAGVETLVSTRLDPGLDPVVEADRRGAIMAIVRLGNKDLEVPGAGSYGDVAQTSYSPSGEIMQASYNPTSGPAVASGVVAGMPIGSAPPYVAGVTTAPYGMPMTGTPIGLPGPPHVPFGIPAGLQKHLIRNHTCVTIPNPTKRVSIDVKQSPGMSYPKPASHAFIHEKACSCPLGFHQPTCDKFQRVVPGRGGAYATDDPDCR